MTDPELRMLQRLRDKTYIRHDDVEWEDLNVLRQLENNGLHCSFADNYWTLTGRGRSVLDMEEI